MSEQALVNAVVVYILRVGGVATRINAGVRFYEDGQGRRRAFRGARKGTADVIGCLCGRYVAIECKLPGNGPTEEQLQFLADVEQAGGVGLVAYGLEDVVALHERLAAPHPVPPQNLRF